MFRKPVFWIIFTLFTICCSIFALKFFSKAFPIANLDLQMDRQQALGSARELIEKSQLVPEGFRQAASFVTDYRVQNYVELEVGGSDAFNKMLREGLYSPYTWQVRHFKEGETREALLRFTPTGQPYGFRVKLPEDLAGAALLSDSARAIAEGTAQNNWQIHLNKYELVETSQEVRPSGRVDHTFVYERPDVRIKEGRYRLSLVVGGDQLTELTHFIKIPEAFSRQYEEMRSANNTISSIALIAAVLLYVVGGCIIGLFFLSRQRWLLWRKALFWGTLVAFMQFLAGINNFPLSWMEYDTALSTQNFVLEQLIRLVVNFLIFSILFSLTFMAAETLTRKAFPHHAQFWRLWRPEVASSPTVLGYTISGYYLVAFFIALQVATYLFATQVLGWWSPSEEMFQPDLLASYFPWLSSIANSFQAGFWEETLFRAVPLAGAALLGQKFGGRKLWIGAALVLQAIIFGAGHANYAQQPAYARIIELIVPSLLFAALYLSFGLLPAIVLHFSVDVVYMAMPLFISTAPGIWIDRIIVLLMMLIPLWVVLQARLRKKAFRNIEASNYNNAWQPPEKEEPKPETTPIEVTQTMSKQTRLIAYLVGAIGIVLWLLTSNFQNNAPRLHMDRTEAEALAQKTLSEKGVALSNSWETLGSVQALKGQDDRFVWQEGNQEIYQQLLGSYLVPPRWKIRYAQFEGDVAERAEEYHVYLPNKNEIVRLNHILPEARAGAKLEQSTARVLADSTVSAQFGMEPARLKLVSSEPSELPNRKDWEFIFADSFNYPLKDGEARISVKIAGNQVVDVSRYIHVPEEWIRRERSQQSIALIFRILCVIVVFGIIGGGVIWSIINWARRNFSVSLFLFFFELLFVIWIVRFINSWPQIIAEFSTAEPLSNQIIISIAGSVVLLLLIAAGLSLIIGLIPSWKRAQQAIKINRAIEIGICMGLFIAGIRSTVDRFAPSLAPFWADYSSAGGYLPFLGFMLDILFQYIFMTSVLFLIYMALDRLTNGWSKKYLSAVVMMLVLGLGIVGIYSIESIPFWLVSGLVSGIVLIIVYILGFRYQLLFIPFASLAVIWLNIVRDMVFNAYTGVILGGGLAICLVGILAIYWFWRLNTGK